MNMTSPPARPPTDPLLQAYEEADRLLDSDAALQPPEAVRDRVLAAALAARAAEAAPAAVSLRRGGAANAPRWRWAAIAASVCTVSLATLVALRVQIESPPEEFAREAPVAKAPAPAAQPAPDGGAEAMSTPPPAVAAPSAPAAPAPADALRERQSQQARKAASVEAERRANLARSEVRQREAAKSAAAAAMSDAAVPAAPAAAPLAQAEPSARRQAAAPAAAPPAEPAQAPAAPLAKRESTVQPSTSAEQAAAAPMAAARPAPAARAEAEHDGRLRERSSANVAAGAAAPAAKTLQAPPARMAGTLGSASTNPNAMLQRAAEAGHLDGVKQALVAGANQQAINAALHAAAERGHLEVLRAVLAAGADVSSINRYGGTVLIPASHYGHVAIVRELLQTTRIDRNHVNNLGWTALLEAVLLGDGDAAHTQIVKLLLAHGADPNIADRAGVTPLQHARQRGYTEMAAAIEAAGGR